jgi:protein involved in polysaccharide export with SLBB domain/capsular polysaccharide biosynthesis protein
MEQSTRGLYLLTASAPSLVAFRHVKNVLNPVDHMKERFGVTLELPPTPLGAATGPAESPELGLIRHPGAPEPQPAPGPLKPADFWPFAQALGRRWPWLLIGTVATALIGFYAGLSLWKSTYTATANLVRYESPNATELVSFPQIAPQTFATLLRSPELLRRVGIEALPPLPAEAVNNALRVIPERDSDIIVVSMVGTGFKDALDLVNIYAREAVRYTQEMQRKAAQEVSMFATQQLAQVESQIATQHEAIRALPPPALLPANGPRSPVAEKLQTARDELVDLMVRYTDAHPRVQAQRAKVAALETQLTDKAANPTGEPPVTSDLEILRGKLQVLESSRLGLVERHRMAQSFAENPPGYYQLLSPATPRDVVENGREIKVIFLTVLAGIIGLGCAVALVLLIEAMDDRLKTPAEVTRVTHLPVLASAGDLSRMKRHKRDDWGFRAWTSLQRRLTPSPSNGLVCGFTSTARGEGCSTLVNLLAKAANQRGFRVLTIATRSQEGEDEPERRRNGYGTPPPDSPEFSANILSSPAEVTQKFTGPNSPPLVHIALPDWQWDLERRRQWQAALRDWSQIPSIAVLIELPPAHEPEAVMLAEYLPNLVWLAERGKAKAAETREQLETLRHANCRLIGALLNHAPSSFFERRFARWLCSFLLLGILSSGMAQAQDAQPGAEQPPAETNVAFGVVGTKRAAWQQRLTLGPGDLLNFSLYGEPELTRQEVPVGPDGRVSYLEAQDIGAAGRTIDELRAEVDKELEKFRRAPRSMITPAAFHSKKYFMLGGVADRGVFTLDRPITIIEAVARARGLETGLSDRTTVELVDLSRSFLARQGKRMEVNFEKLFQAGDLSQNIALEPNDYLYFPVSNLKEIYVLGEVQFPGPVAYNPGISTVGAISVRGGFTDRAWKKKLLVVRGSLNQPETFIVNSEDVLYARGADFRLEPKDIIYVGHRPWIKAEELLDAAATAFIEAAVITFTGDRIGPFIR